MNIWIAASDGRIDLVEKFLNDGNGITSNTKDLNGYTPIHAAASYGHVELLRKLCRDYNGDINIADNDGDTPLHHVEDINIAKVMIEELNCDFKILNSEGKTALDTFEEDAEFPELITYMRGKMGISVDDASMFSGVDQEQLAQFKDSLRYTLENDPVDENDVESMERRKKLEAIIQGENAEQELEKYIRDIIRTQMMGDHNDAQDMPNKRQK